MIARLSEENCERSATLLASCCLLLSGHLGIASAAIAQILPDGTTGTQVEQTGNIFAIDGGRVEGSNLFHSFSEFSIPAGAEARFNNAASAANIFTRVTGTQPSNIDGLLQANGIANVFLLNPNGIVFGPDARLDVGGSFLATTADSIVFADGVAFSASDAQSQPLLTISAPVGLQFGSSAAAIANRSVAVSPAVAVSPEFMLPTGLQVLPGNTLALVGGDVLLDGGNLTAIGGRVELGSAVENSFVTLDFTNEPFRLSYGEAVRHKDILLRGAIVITNLPGTGGGSVQVQGRQIAITDGSTILSAGTTDTDALSLSASEAIIVESSNIGINAQALESDASGNITIDARQVILRDGGTIEAGTTVASEGSNISVKAGSVEISGGNQSQVSVLSTSTSSEGSAGNITIETASLRVLNGARIESSTVAGGNGGTINISATELVKVSGSTVIDGETLASSISAASIIPPSSSTPPSGNGGSVTIETSNLSVSNGAEISVSNEGMGNAGTLSIVTTGDTFLEDAGRIAASTASGGGGDLVFDVGGATVLRNNSSISTTAGGTGSGGNIDIKSGFLVGLGNSDITADAFEGPGGAIRIASSGIFGFVIRSAEQLQAEVSEDLTDFDPSQLSTSDITAISQSNPELSGEVTVEELDSDPSEELLHLSEGTEDLSDSIGLLCNSVRDSEFIATGRGGLPPVPGDTFDRPALLEDLGEDVRLPKPLVEAKDWKMGKDGEVELSGPRFEDGTALLVEGRQHFRKERYEAAIARWQEALKIFQATGANSQATLIESNLAIATARIGRWEEANRHLTQGWQWLAALPDKERAKLSGILLNARGTLALERGASQRALGIWEAAIEAYQEKENDDGEFKAKLARAQALRALGFNRRATVAFAETVEATEGETSERRAIALRAYGNALHSVGEFERAEEILQQSLAVSRSIAKDPQTASAYASNRHVSAAFIALGNVERDRQNDVASQQYYEAAEAIAPSESLLAIARLNRWSLAMKAGDSDTANDLQPKIASHLETLPPSRNGIYTLLGYGRVLQEFQNRYAKSNDRASPDAHAIAAPVRLAIQHAEELADERALAYGEGFLGRAYEIAGRWEEARDLTEKALTRSHELAAPEMEFRWQWQLGRLLGRMEKRAEAIAAYQDATNLLQGLRSDLASIDPEVQFSFADEIEPLYRQYIDLLLDPDREPSGNSLALARDAIDALRLAELDNFFHDACLLQGPIAIDEIGDPNTAVLSVILLEESVLANAPRMEIILSLPDRPLRRYTVVVNTAEVDFAVERMRKYVTDGGSLRGEYLPIAQTLYDWLIRPVENDLADSGVQNLAFVLDGSLRNAPLPALSDGERFLIEKYSLSVSPSMRLVDPQPFTFDNLRVLAAGLSEPHQEFPPLLHVWEELDIVRDTVPTKILLNEAFTQPALQRLLRKRAFPGVHIATHGSFSSNIEDTFLLVWGDRIGPRELERLLKSASPNGNPIELLVLSACQTALGDKRAALGLAGISVRAGARSTLASLWLVDDRATSALMKQFYKEISAPHITKAEALRRAQLYLLQHTHQRHPFFWSGFVLVGNWL